MEQSSEQINDDGWDRYRTKSMLKRNLELKVDYKRVSCRYGHGCTHIHDPLHLERFSHPEIPVVDGISLSLLSSFDSLADAIRRNFMCYECGMMFLTLPDLQVSWHLSHSLIDRSSFTCNERLHGQTNPLLVAALAV